MIVSHNNYEKKWVIISLFLFATFFFLLAYFSKGTYDPGDGIRHYLISRYCWSHSDLLMYSWGKPFFTFISSPFSQFGLIGINCFNILCGVFSGYFAYKIAKHLNLNYSYLVIPFLLFSPIYFPTMNSGLTEPFFGFILIFSVYMFYSNRYLWACIIVSFLPFIRTEGFLILPLFFIVCLFQKKMIPGLLLGFGSFVYSIIGFFYYDDFLWVINQNPYNGENRAFYGSGELLHFVKNHDLIFGNALLILFILGCLAWFYLYLKKNKKKADTSSLPFPIFTEAIIIYGPFFIYFIAHSFMWWKGLANSLGLLRVLAAVAPLSAIICLRGLNFSMIPVFRKNKYIEISLIAIITLFIFLNPFKQYYYPFKVDAESELIQEAGEWFRKSEYTHQKVYYLFPYLAHVLEVDSFDPNKVGELWGLYPTIKAHGIEAIPDSSIVFWDAHFGPNECKIPLDTILNDANFKLLKTFRPIVPFKVLGDYNFEVYVFMKLSKPMPTKVNLLNNTSCDFEQAPESYTNALIKEITNAHSGKQVNVLDNTSEFGYTLKYKISDISPQTTEINYDFFLYTLSDSSFNDDVMIVCSITNTDGKNILWEGKSVNQMMKLNEWNESKHKFNIYVNTYNQNDELSIYIWNKKKKAFYIDDLTITFKGRF